MRPAQASGERRSPKSQNQLQSAGQMLLSATKIQNEAYVSG